MREPAGIENCGDPAAQILELLERGLVADQAARDAEWTMEHPQGKTNPSVTDATKCPRQVWYSLRNVPPSEPFSVDQLLTFAVGRSVEETICRAIAGATGGKIIREQRVELDAGAAKVTGRIDLLVHTTDPPLLTEIKSINAKAFSRMRRYEPDGKPAHRAQLNQYLHALSVDRGVLLYIVTGATSRELTRYAINLEYDDALFRQTMADAGAVAFLARSGQEIARPAGYVAGKFPCAWCPYQSKCWEG